MNQSHTTSNRASQSLSPGSLASQFTDFTPSHSAAFVLHNIQSSEKNYLSRTFIQYCLSLLSGKHICTFLLLSYLIFWGTRCGKHKSIWLYGEYLLMVTTDLVFQPVRFYELLIDSPPEFSVTYIQESLENAIISTNYLLFFQINNYVIL